MKTFSTVNQVRRSLDNLLRSQGDSHDGAHYVRPDGTKGPVVRYLPKFVELLFAVDRIEGGWVISKAWSSRKQLPDNQIFWFQTLVEAGK
jgi:hypothetical protein